MSDFSNDQASIVTVGQVSFGNHLPFSLIAGPCQMESEAHAFDMAGALQAICARLEIGLVYKSSFDKANRTSGSAQRGIGIEKGVEIFAKIRKAFDLPVITDVHESWHCAHLAGAVDILQIPAFLCRQTDLLLAAAATGLAINVKKGQFLAPWDMKNVIAKIRDAGNDRAMACDRGTSFGYNTLVSDFRGLPIMAEQCRCPVIFDATHSVQQPGGQGGSSGGQRELCLFWRGRLWRWGLRGFSSRRIKTPIARPRMGQT
jgi:2-dehydro-3-deoxyphosphooctonate aldolase (KDO 8-P synthase)